MTLAFDQSFMAFYLCGACSIPKTLLQGADQESRYNWTMPLVCCRRIIYLCIAYLPPVFWFTVTCKGTFLYHSQGIQAELIGQLKYQVVEVKISSTQQMDLAIWLLLAYDLPLCNVCCYIGAHSLQTNKQKRGKQLFCHILQLTWGSWLLSTDCRRRWQRGFLRTNCECGQSISWNFPFQQFLYCKSPVRTLLFSCLMGEEKKQTNPKVEMAN